MHICTGFESRCEVLCYICIIAVQKHIDTKCHIKCYWCINLWFVNSLANVNTNRKIGYESYANWYYELPIFHSNYKEKPRLYINAQADCGKTTVLLLTDSS